MGAHVAGMRICPALIFRLAHWALGWRVFKNKTKKKKKKKKKGKEITNRQRRKMKKGGQIHTCVQTLANNCGNTQKKTSAQREKARCNATTARETIKRSDRINSGMTEGQSYAAVHKNVVRGFPSLRCVCVCVYCKYIRLCFSKHVHFPMLVCVHTYSRCTLCE